MLLREDNLMKNLIRKLKKSNTGKENKFLNLILKLETIFLKKKVFICHLKPFLLKGKVRLIDLLFTALMVLFRFCKWL